MISKRSHRGWWTIDAQCLCGVIVGFLCGFSLLPSLFSAFPFYQERQALPKTASLHPLQHSIIQQIEGITQMHHVPLETKNIEYSFLDSFTIPHVISARYERLSHTRKLAKEGDSNDGTTLEFVYVVHGKVRVVSIRDGTRRIQECEERCFLQASSSSIDELFVEPVDAKEAAGLIVYVVGEGKS